MVKQFHVPKAHHQQIIGSRGATVKQISQKYSVKVQVPAVDDNSTLIVVEGDQEDAAVAYIEELLGFSVSYEPLQIVSLNATHDDAKKLFGENGKLSAFVKKFGIGIRLPRAHGEHTVIQGNPEAISKAKRELSTQLKKDVIDAGSAPESIKQKLNPEFDTIAESLFFGDGDDDDRDFSRFLEVLKSGSKTLDICVFTITDNRIANTIEREFRDGVKVRIITDNHTSEALGSDVARLASVGIPVKMDISEGHMHHKFAVIDGKLLINGSFNWTTGASNNNYENVVITNEKTLVANFAAEFERLWNDEKRFQAC